MHSSALRAQKETKDTTTNSPEIHMGIMDFSDSAGYINRFSGSLTVLLYIKTLIFRESWIYKDLQGFQHLSIMSCLSFLVCGMTWWYSPEHRNLSKAHVGVHFLGSDSNLMDSMKIWSNQKAITNHSCSNMFLYFYTKWTIKNVYNLDWLYFILGRLKHT